jgi:hypothetical protein
MTSKAVKCIVFKVRNVTVKSSLIREAARLVASHLLRQMLKNSLLCVISASIPPLAGCTIVSSKCSKMKAMTVTES